MSAGPLLTAPVHAALLAARAKQAGELQCSLDLGRSSTTVGIGAAQWSWRQRGYPYLQVCRPHTVYAFGPSGFAALARFDGVLIKLVPTDWGPPSFEIGGIKMLVSERISPYADAEQKVRLIAPRGKTVLDTCGGLGYFALWCLRGGARRVLSFEKSPDVLWLRSQNPWSPGNAPMPATATATATSLELVRADVTVAIAALSSASVDAILHDPPRISIAGELYAQAFYAQLARVLRPQGRLFHYTGAPQRASHGRNLAREVTRRLSRAGFATTASMDGVLAVRRD